MCYFLFYDYVLRNEKSQIFEEIAKIANFNIDSVTIFCRWFSTARIQMGMIYQEHRWQPQMGADINIMPNRTSISIKQLILDSR